MLAYNPETHSKVGFSKTYNYASGKMAQHCEHTFLISKEDISKNGFEAAVSPHIHKILKPNVANWVNKAYLDKDNTFRKGNGYTFTRNLISYLKSKPELPKQLNTCDKLSFRPSDDIQRLLGFEYDRTSGKFPVMSVEDTSTYTEDEKTDCINTLIEELTKHFTRAVFEPIDVIDYDEDCIGAGACICVEEVRPVMVCRNELGDIHY